MPARDGVSSDIVGPLPKLIQVDGRFQFFSVVGSRTSASRDHPSLYIIYNMTVFFLLDIKTKVSAVASCLFQGPPD